MSEELELTAHVAGPAMQIGPHLRQRCMWCGAVLIDQDLTMVAVPIEDADKQFPTWEPGALIASTDREGNMVMAYTALDNEAAHSMPVCDYPVPSCLELDPAVTA